MVSSRVAEEYRDINDGLEVLARLLVPIVIMFGCTQFDAMSPSLRHDLSKALHHAEMVKNEDLTRHWTSFQPTIWSHLADLRSTKIETTAVFHLILPDQQSAKVSDTVLVYVDHNLNWRSHHTVRVDNPVRRTVTTSLAS